MRWQLGLFHFRSTRVAPELAAIGCEANSTSTGPGTAFAGRTTGGRGGRSFLVFR
jgi:hypothetical protein